VTASHLVVGPARHGVVSFALDLAASLRRSGGPTNVVRLEHWHDLGDAVGSIQRCNGVHLNFTDRLFGSTPSDAAQRVVALVRDVEAAGSRVTVTLHDVPQPSDGGNYLQRVEAYRAVCAAVHGLVTNSDHERSLLEESRIAAPADVVAIPLPLDVAGDLPRRPAVGDRHVGVFGFVYPGKGHDDVLAAMAGLPPSVGFLAVGEPSAGHDDLVRSLADTAERAGRRFSVTGYVPDEALAGVLHDVTVPVAHHRHVSASGSINTWIAARRRPLVPVNRYTVEHAERHPGTLTPYPDTPRGLRAALEYAMAEPDSTWIAAGTVSGSPSHATAQRYARELARWHD
jgi:glycosyltransferase involved in cell wall biosynthesis